MELNQLRVFYQVARLKSFSAAADALFVTRPAVSIRIRQLEEYYDVRLFERTGRRIELTEAGRTLQTYAEKVFKIVAEADECLREINGRISGMLKISTGLTIGTYYLAPLINVFKRRYTNVDIRMDVKNKRGVIDDILSLRSDIGFLGNPPTSKNLDIVPLWKEELVVIAPKSHPFGRQASLNPTQLTGQPFILREKGSGTREYIEKRLRRQGLTHVVMEIGSDEAIKRAVSVGLGISIIPIGVAAREVKRGLIRTCRLAGEPLLLEYCMIRHRDKYLSALIRAFMETASELLPLPDRGSA